LKECVNTNLIIDRHQLLAVSAPGSIELDENILFGVEDDSVKVAGNEGGNRGLVPVLGEFLGQQVLLQN
jgi:hypothetical protein